MLVLSRRQGEKIIIGTPPDEVTITTVEIRKGTVRLGIEAPDDVPVLRAELVRWPAKLVDGYGPP